MKQMDKKQVNRRGLLRITVFILLFSVLFVALSNFARPVFLFTESYIDFREEEAPIDVLFMGGSSTLVYWSPMLAFDRYGISSYSLSDSAMAPALMKGLLEDTLKYRSPKLYVIDLRAFENLESEPGTYTEGFFRTYTDALPYSWNRVKTIHYASQFATFEYSPQALYADLFYYHGEWRTWLNKPRKPWANFRRKGQMLPCTTHKEVTLNAYQDITTRKPLSENTVTILNDLLDFLEARNLPVLCLLNAYSFENADERAAYNSVFDILDERGVPYLDTNLFYEEMGLDGTTDFYNKDHVNAIGSEKYTEWVAQWLLEHYELEDHRDDPRFQTWREYMPSFYEEFDSAKQYYWNLIEEEEQINAG